MEHRQSLFMPDSSSTTKTNSERTNARRNIIVAALAILATVATFYTIRVMQDAPLAVAGGPDREPMSMPPAAVYVEMLGKESVQAEAIVTGILRAASEAKIAAREPGAIVKMLVDEGFEVKQNEIIAKLKEVTNVQVTEAAWSGATVAGVLFVRQGVRENRESFMYFQ